MTDDCPSPLTHWTVLVLAGQRPGVDPLASHFGATYKALVPVAGEAMLTHVVRTLHTVPAVRRIIVMGQDTGVLAGAVDAGGGAEIIASQSGISASILSFATGDDSHWPILVTTADHPLLTRAMVEAFLAAVRDCDVAVAMVERRVMMARFPQSQRTWLRFADGAWSGANLFALTGPAALPALQLWARAEADRKRPWRLFRHFGVALALRAITRTIGLGDALGRAGRKLGLRARLVAMDDAVAAIDVDKPSDHELAERIMAQRVAATGR